MFKRIFMFMLVVAVLTVAVPSPAFAAPQSPNTLNHSGAECTYAGKTYGEGAEVDQAGTIKICEDGKWRKKVYFQMKTSYFAADVGVQEYPKQYGYFYPPKSYR